jgi:hypothetical protein
MYMGSFTAPKASSLRVPSVYGSRVHAHFLFGHIRFSFRLRRVPRRQILLDTSYGPENDL